MTSLDYRLNKIIPQWDLLHTLVSRDIKARYRKSFLGIIWTLINPISYSLILWIVFVSIFKSNLANGTQFAPYLLAGVITINFFTQGVVQSAESIASGSGIFLRIKTHPQLFIFANVLANSINFFLGIIALGFVSVLSQSEISPKFPLVLIVGFCLTLLITGFGMALSIIFIRFDDSKYIVSIILQILSYLTPVFYPKEILSPSANKLVSMNPLSSYLDVFRNLFNGTEFATPFDWFYMFSSSVVVFLLGRYIFIRFWTKTLVML